MREFGKVLSRFWTGETAKQLRKMGSDELVVALHLMTSPHANMIGLYSLPVPYLMQDTGLSFEGASKALRRVCGTGFATYDQESEHIFVVEFARVQVNPVLLVADNRHKSVVGQLRNLAKNPLSLNFWRRYQVDFHLPALAELGIAFSESPSPSEAPSKPLRSQEQDQGQGQEQDHKDHVGLAPHEVEGSASAAPRQGTLAVVPAAPAKDRGPSARTIATDWVTWFNGAFKRQFQVTDGLVDDVEKLVRWKYSLRDMKLVAAHRRKLWEKKPEMAEHLVPATLLRPGNFKRYLGEAREWETIELANRARNEAAAAEKNRGRA